MQLKIFFRSFPETSKCPSCSQIGKIRRSRSRNILESLIKASRLWGIYKCRECGWRGIISKFSFNRSSLVTIFFYIILVFSVAYILIKILKRNFGDS